LIDQVKRQLNQNILRIASKVIGRMLNAIPGNTLNTLDTHDAQHFRRFFLGLLFLGSAGLLASSVYRAATYPFTHDESLSFAGFAFQSEWIASSNNHLLNTLLMWLCSTLLGNSELSLRLPNILAHAIYLTSVFLFIKRFRYAAVQAAGFALLNLNPFILDFFSLARGYGLALAFQMLSLYLLALAHQERQRGFEKYLFPSVIASALAVFANFSFLNCFLPLLLVSAWYLLTDASLRRLSRVHLFAAFLLLSGSSIFLVIVLEKILDLQMGGAFYFGGHDGFISDTVGSIVRCSLYGAFDTNPLESAISAAIVFLFVAILVFGIFQFFVRKNAPLYVSFLLMLSSAASLSVLQHLFLHALFPIERAATYYIILFAVTLLSVLDFLTLAPSCRWQRPLAISLAAAMAAVLLWHFVFCFRIDSNYSWAYDRHNKDVLDMIRRDHDRIFPGKPVKLGTSWVFEPSLNFYRVTRGDTWLIPLTRSPIRHGDGYDYLYANESDLHGVPMNHYVRLISYPDTQTALLRSVTP
jgi:hypothetical protein